MSTRTENAAAPKPGGTRASWLTRRIPTLLVGANFRRYWAAQSISMLGDQISGIAIPLAAVLVLHASAPQMGYLTALQWLPSLLFGLHAGAFVDRTGKRRAIMIAADLGRFALLLKAINMLPFPLYFSLMKRTAGPAARRKGSKVD